MLRDPVEHRRCLERFPGIFIVVLEFRGNLRLGLQDLVFSDQRNSRIKQKNSPYVPWATPENSPQPTAYRIPSCTPADAGPDQTTA